MTAVELSNAPAVVPLLIMPSQPPIYVRKQDEEDCAKLIMGHRALIQEPGEPEVRRILDLGAREGAFQVYARLRFPYAWCTSVEGDPELRRLCELNSLPGNDVNDGTWSLPLGHVVLVRIAAGWLEAERMVLEGEPEMLFYDGCQGTPGDEYTQVAGGMRAKGQPCSWWIRRDA